MYQLPDAQLWKGRNDPQYGDEGLLWHHIIKTCSLSETTPEHATVLLGFCTDEGVKRNLGRPGAVSGPDAIRKGLCSLAFHHLAAIVDGGNCVAGSGNLEPVQMQCAALIRAVLSKRSFPILLGGGHEISYSHFKGLAEFAEGKKVGIINFDPHLDVRTYEQGAHSGSWARQILEEFPEVSYLPIGINPQVNVQALFSYMKSRNQGYLTMDDLVTDSEKCREAIQRFALQVDLIGVTLDLDVFSSGIAPGVSAPAAYGAFPQHLRPLFSELAKTGKWISFDVAEMNPAFDDGRTAKLAALMIDHVVGLTHS